MKRPMKRLIERPIQAINQATDQAHDQALDQAHSLLACCAALPARHATAGRCVRHSTVKPHGTAQTSALQSRPVRARPQPNGARLETAQNRLIEMLPRKDRLRLLASCESVQLEVGQVLCEAGEVVRYAYFPVDGFMSLLTRIEDHPSLEVGMLGREGMYGAALVLGVASAPMQVMVQGPGAAWRIPAAALQAEVELSPTLRHILLRYVFVVMEQMATSAACLRFHLIEPRLARWLLMSEDRAHANQFHVTHEFLACMLGVRRVGVTVAAGDLQRRGLISYHRGDVMVLDRRGLEAAACPCYARQRLAYEKQMPADHAARWRQDTLPRVRWRPEAAPGPG